jgi:hypothetical protein
MGRDTDFAEFALVAARSRGWDVLRRQNPAASW